LGKDVTMTSPPQLNELPSAESEVVDIVRDLIRIDTSNDGTGVGPGEAEAAEYVHASLAEVGYQPEIIPTTSAHRAAVGLRIPGQDSRRPALLVHGHLDVVPAVASDWSVPPFGAEVIDEMVWGRGAVDMKDMDGMILSVVRQWGRMGYQPPRDIVLLFTPDEEAGGRHGAHWLVDNRPDLFEGVTEAIGEVGGFSLTIRDDLRLYLIQTAEKGIAWLKLTARGKAGHGSMINEDNAVVELARAVTRIGNREPSIQLTPTTQRFLHELSEVLGIEVDPANLGAALGQVGTLATLLGASMMNTANPSMLNAGYKVNVIPETATAHVDGRFLPGGRDALVSEIKRLAGDRVDVEILIEDIALEAPFEGDLVNAMSASLCAEDAFARPVPYMMSGGTDAKAFSRLGITGYGFAPLQLPPDLDFAGLFHGVDERVPVSSLRFGVRVLERFFRLV
jgi:acetylornithine deacetylase/succinyl-diaminopimelate desuccinylase-like protein